MLKQLTPQVTVHTVPTQQFKTIEINFHFIEPITAKKLVRAVITGNGFGKS